MSTSQVTTGLKLSQAAPTMPAPCGPGEEGKLTYGVQSPLSAATVPSVYNKKLSKLFRGRLAVLSGNCTVNEALMRMAKFNICSVPVTKSKRDTTILGFVDMLDFLAYLCKLVGKESSEKSFSSSDIENLKSKSEIFKNTKICDIVDCSKRDPFHVMNGEESLADAVQQYLKGVHRIAITDDQGDMLGVVSQWTIANYLATVPTDDKEWIPTFREPLKKFEYKTTDLKTVNLKDCTLNCFLQMNELRISSLAVVDDSGLLCGNLSASDLKGMHLFFNDFTDLLKPVSQFLSTIRKAQLRPENFAIGVTLDTPIKEIITKLNDEIIHRVYIVDEKFKPIGVFSLTDLLKGFVVDTHKFATFAKKTAIPPEEEE